MNNIQNKTMENENTSYNGKDALEIMAEALNYNRFLFGLIKNALNNKKENKVLDFGAGSGTFARMAKDYCIYPPPR
ncbi:MAG: hypothetical protein BHW64_06020 [Candidatus Melainabacteria bacterium LEY3_CP_29_8]|nr:MAG: hypothetical protein BHW64_06020 [Candidatus Melainabacteria bacterium LEY3_CP_29_8]